MIDQSNFKLWLSEKTNYSPKTISNIVSRLKRADSILPWFNDPLYIFKLEHNDTYQLLPCDVKSQLKRAVTLYCKYADDSRDKNIRNLSRHNVLSLFANIGVAEAYLNELGINVVVANELIERRAVLYSKIYPDSHMICGDITKDSIFEQIVDESIKNEVEIIMATPPCQGMSTAGQQAENDERNLLICQVINAVLRINPKYVFIENVPLFYQTKILVDGQSVLIPDLIGNKLGDKYVINKYVIDTKDYSVPQTRERAIILMTRKDISKTWELPPKDDCVVTMKDAIGNIPIIDPYVDDVSEQELLQMFPHYYEREKVALSISPWNIPPHHVKRQVVAMQHTPTGCTAFDNPQYYPIKENGEPVKGYHNTYKRQNWNTPAYTVTMDNRKISSQNNVHPGRLEFIDKSGNAIYSDPRALTLYELMLIMSLPSNWPIPCDTSEAFLRRIIGEGIPPVFVKKVFNNLIQEHY